MKRRAEDSLVAELLGFCRIFGARRNRYDWHLKTVKSPSDFPVDHPYEVETGVPFGPFAVRQSIRYAVVSGKIPSACASLSACCIKLIFNIPPSHLQLPDSFHISVADRSPVAVTPKATSLFFSICRGVVFFFPPFTIPSEFNFLISFYDSSHRLFSFIIIPTLHQ